MRKITLLKYWALSLSLMACSHIWPQKWGWQQEPVSPSSASVPKDGSGHDPSTEAAKGGAPSQSHTADAAAEPNTELKMARMAARMDEMERVQNEQKQKIYLLEKGLMTGIVPGELMAPEEILMKNKDKVPDEEKHALASLPPQQVAAASPPTQQQAQPALKLPENSASTKPVVALNTPLTPEQEQQYQAKITEAGNFFSSQQYGNAIALYEKIGTEYGGSVTGGNHLYWIGLGWFYLKSYDLAVKKFNQLITEYQNSPMAPKAKFYLAQVEYAMGLKEKSVNRLNSIIKDYPDNEIALQAQWEIKQIEEKL